MVATPRGVTGVRPTWLDAEEYPFESHFLELHEGRLHFVDEGPRGGEPVLFVHGNPTWSFLFRRLIRAVTPERRAIAFDHMGMGLSDRPCDTEYSYRLARRIADLETLVEHLRIDVPLTLVMHDWGGMIGMGYAVRHPAKIRRVVVLNSSVFGLPRGARFPWQLALARTPGLGALLVRGLNLFSRGAVRHCVVRRALPDPVRAAYLAPYSSWRDRRAVHRFVQDIPLDENHASFSCLRDISARSSDLKRVPMLICWGMRDFVFGSEFLAEWRRRFPDAEVHEFAEAGHFLLEDAGEDVERLLVDWLRRTP